MRSISKFGEIQNRLFCRVFESAVIAENGTRHLLRTAYPAIFENGIDLHGNNLAQKGEYVGLRLLILCRIFALPKRTFAKINIS